MLVIVNKNTELKPIVLLELKRAYHQIYIIRYRCSLLRNHVHTPIRKP